MGTGTVPSDYVRARAVEIVNAVRDRLGVREDAIDAVALLVDSGFVSRVERDEWKGRAERAETLANNQITYIQQLLDALIERERAPAPAVYLEPRPSEGPTVPEGCVIYEFGANICERGTPGCEVSHAPRSGEAPPEEDRLVTLTRAQARLFRDLRENDQRDIDGLRRETIDALVNTDLAVETSAGDIRITDVGRGATLLHGGQVLKPVKEIPVTPMATIAEKTAENDLWTDEDDEVLRLTAERRSEAAQPETVDDERARVEGIIVNGRRFIAADASPGPAGLKLEKRATSAEKP